MIINDAGYLIVGLVHATVCIVLIILFCKFILRPDTSRLKSITPELLDRNPLPPMTFPAEIYRNFLCCVYLHPADSQRGLRPPALGAYVKANTYGISLGYTFLLCAIRIDKKPLLNFPQTMRRFSWGTYFLIASAILLEMP